MKLIDTSGITAISQYPGLANVGGQSVGNPPFTASGSPSLFQGLDFLQQNVLDMVDAICRSMILDATKPTIIATIPLGGFFAGVSSPQYVYYKGEVFYVPSQTLLAAVGRYQIANITANPTDASPNPLTTMSDGTQVSIHNQRTIIFSWVTSGTGNFPDPGTWEIPQTNFSCFVPFVNVVGGAGQPIYKTDWSQLSRLAFYILGNEVTIQGDANYASGAAGLMFILPLGYRPANYTLVPVIQNGGTIAALSIDTSGNVSFMGSTSGGGYINVVTKFTIL